MSSTYYRQQGAAFVLAIMSLLPIIALAAFAIDISYILLERTKLQAAADAGALAGILKFPSESDAVNEAKDIVKANYDPDSKYLDMDNDVSVKTGCWTFSPGGTGGYFNENCTNPPNALKVIVQSGSNHLNAIFGHLMGFKNYQIVDDAIAYLGGSSSGELVCAAICEKAYIEFLNSGAPCLVIIEPTSKKNNNVRRINVPDQDDVTINEQITTYHGSIHCPESGVVKYALIEEASSTDCSSSKPVESNVLDILTVNFDKTNTCADFTGSSIKTAVLVD